MAFFVKDLIRLFPTNNVFDLIQLHLATIPQPKETKSSASKLMLSTRIEFLQIVTDSEDYIPLNLPLTTTIKEKIDASSA
jgi:hypothetical protein